MRKKVYLYIYLISLLIIAYPLYELIKKESYITLAVLMWLIITATKQLIRIWKK